MHIIFETPRLLLRRFTIEDASLIQQLNSDPEVLKYLHEPPLETIEQAKHILNTIILPQYENDLGRWAIHTKDTNEFIGWCGLKHRPELDEIDLGYRLKKTAWGKGFAKEAALYTVEHGLKKLQLPIITGRAHIDNTASLYILEKIGMQFIREETIDNCPVKTYTISKTDL
jgi:ribosomal-protein-alanine N-acetyltransferase